MTTKPVTRRKFLKTAAITLGASTVACYGLSTAATQLAAPAAPVDTPHLTYGKEPSSMKKRILVAYATKTGSTVGVASAIGETLAGRGYAVDVKPINEDPEVAGYQSVIIGSAVNGGKWLPEAVQFVQRRQGALSQLPVAVFCVHIMNLGSDEQSRANRLAYLDAVRDLISPTGEAYFAGMGMDPKTTSPVVRWIAGLFKITAEGDCRDWGKIRTWAQGVFA